MKKKDRKKYLHDLVLAGVCLFVAAAAWVTVVLTAKKGSCAVVTVDGEVFGTYPLSDDAEIEIDTDYGENTLVISDGRADMTDADCPDKLCVRQHSISRTGETIVCLPHRVVVTVSDSGEDDGSGADLIG